MNLERIKNKRNVLIVMSLLIIGFIIIGVSYAIWQITLTQTEKNIVTTGCFNVSMDDNGSFALKDAYPITDNEGMNLTPYTFTLTNNCGAYASYQINL